MQSGNRKRRAICLVVLALLCAGTADNALAVCPQGVPMNPVTDVCWQCIFPFSIAGIQVFPGPYENNYPDAAQMPICVCPAINPPFFKIGIPISFWEPARIVETVSTPYCFPSVGIGMGNPTGFQSGATKATAKKHDQAGETFAHSHYMIAPWWAIMEIATDVACVEHSGFDLAYITEVDPRWTNSLLSMVIAPEALLFANPVAGMACIADSVSSNAGFSISPLFWCTASAGNVYPLTGFKNNSVMLMAHEGIAARTQFLMARQGLACDTAVNVCGCVHTPIWIKHNFRHHVAKPVRDVWCHPFGRSDMMWATGKNPPFYGDNFAWQQFRRRSCCAFAIGLGGSGSGGNASGSSAGNSALWDTSGTAGPELDW
ncbi:MAG: TraU family protein [Syntrophales bacterium]